MSYLEIIAIAILFFNMGRNEEHEWQEQVYVLQLDKYRSYPYVNKLDDDLLKYFSR